MGNFQKANDTRVDDKKESTFGRKEGKMEYEKVGTVRTRRRPLLMVLARDDRDGTKAVAMKMSRNIRFKRKKHSCHK